ncbi:hypothetical protein ACE1AT_12650 [Pelatocladus sp. BLCC-F211]|uniref:hypothetical protein n=1 Tax=Pelatocladus sp. BLCC-F211 TaxID=3342752 RepID=UPI0035B8F6ED
MKTPQNKSLKQSVPPVPEPKTGNQAVDELRAIREELALLRRDVAKANRELSLKVAFGVIGSLILMWVVGGFLAILLPSLIR